jgi:hypothetical protein
MFVGSVAVNEQMHIQFRRDFDIDRLKESDELLMAMPRRAVADDSATALGLRRRNPTDIRRRTTCGAWLAGTVISLWCELRHYRDVPVTGVGTFPARKVEATSEQTVKFPFLIERYIMGEKVETMVLRGVIVNGSLHPENFQR